jgi:2-succinyl-6-hydroxy-2,4-cyclohexadiene-1-carboxylate synthase
MISPKRPTLLLLHGFLGSPDDWQGVVAALPEIHCIAPALPGHAGSPVPKGLSHESVVDFLLQYLDDKGIARCSVLGYSMGGRIAMQLALRSPQRVQLLIAESANPGIEDEALRRARAAQDDALATQLAESDFADFLQGWYSQPLFATLSPAQRDTLLRRQGIPVALAAALRALSVGRQESLGPRLTSLTCPVHFIVGQKDAKYCRIAESATSSCHIVPGAGHNVHLEKPEAFLALLKELLANSDLHSRADSAISEVSTFS